MGLSRVIDRVSLRMSRLFGRRTELDAVSGYDLWAASYDGENDNLVVRLDDEMFAGMLAGVADDAIAGKVVVDVGCGTGRHWARLLARQPARLLGVDSSPGMLARLRAKYPDAELVQGSGDRLPSLGNESCDVVTSTLALAHLPDVGAALAEWARVLRAEGHLLITDFHPAAAARGACTFRHQGATVAIKHHVHRLEDVSAAAARTGLHLRRLEERVADDSLRAHFEAGNATASFALMRDLPLIYGLHLQKQPAPQVQPG